MGKVRELVDRVGILRPLRVRDFAFLWIGLTVSFIGDGIYIIAIAWQTYDLSNSPSALAAVGIAWSLPQVVLLLVSGVLSDRLDRRLLMIAGDVIRGIAIATIGIMSIGGTLTMTSLIVLVVVYGAGQALFGPAFSSIVPQVVPKELLVQANSLGQFVRPVAWTLIGPLVGGALVAGLGTGWAFVTDAATFAISAVMVGLMRTRPHARSEDERTSPWADLKEGLRYVRSKTWLWVAMLTGTVSLLATWGPWEVLVPYVVRNDLGGSAADLGLVFGAGRRGVAHRGPRDGATRAPPATGDDRPLRHVGRRDVDDGGVRAGLHRVAGDGRGVRLRELHHGAGRDLVHAAAAAGPRPPARPGVEPGLAHLDRGRAAQLRRGRAGGGRLRGRRDADRRRRDRCARDGRVHVLPGRPRPRTRRLAGRGPAPPRYPRHPARLERLWSTAISVVWG